MMHDHDGHCTVRLRRDHGQLVEETYCLDCGAITHTNGAGQFYAPLPIWRWPVGGGVIVRPNFARTPLRAAA